MPTTTLSSFRRFLRVLGAEMLPFVLRDGTPDPTFRALMIRHRVEPDLPNAVLYFEDGNQVEGWWRLLGQGWKAQHEQLDAVARHYRDGSTEERARMAEWLALSAEDRVTHAWSVTLAGIEQRYTADAAVLPKAWRSWTAREYIKGCREFASDDVVGEVIAACIAETHAPLRRQAASRR
jgi:hypothetical protein